MTLLEYIQNIHKTFQQGNSTEHSFRSDLQQLIESIMPNIKATNEPKRQACGSPDYIITKNDIPVGFIETKNIGDKDLEGAKKTGNKEQFDRYKSSLENIIFTDYLDFYFYQDGQFTVKIAIGKQKDNGIEPITAHFQTFENLLKDFFQYVGQTISTPKKLANMMAGKAQLLAEVLEKSLISDETNAENSTLKEQLDSFREILIHDISPKAFADVYAQTIAYGMFAARLNDSDLSDFTRQKAAELIPKSNPFLRKLFQYVAGYDLDSRIVWIVDSLAKIFLACNVGEILKSYEKETHTENPVIHFYETFLSEYDTSLRKARGVWYTPKPVVNFIVRAVDDILKSEFDLKMGLADNSSVKISTKEQEKTIERNVHKVQILDPATGTGTFLVEVVKNIYNALKGQHGTWNNYVEEHLLPRVNGFELLMASYAMAHLQLDLLLKETGYKNDQQRFRIFLTNSLEESMLEKPRLPMMRWLSDEGIEADKIKKQTPVMVILGNPPYSGESQNKKSDWMNNLMEDYKKEPGGKEKLKEKNPKWINDDYVKFLRMGQNYIEKNGSGILAFINPHGFLDNPTFRGIRWNLLKTYDKIYVIDLHGNSKKREISPDGSIDENVFTIMQGVSINIFIKTGKKKNNELSELFHYDLFGKREEKFNFLDTHSLNTTKFQKLTITQPEYYFVPKNLELRESYNAGFKLNELFQLNSVGIVTSNDNLFIDFDKNNLKNKIVNHFKTIDESLIEPITYRVFDLRYIYYNIELIERSRANVMQHFSNKNAIGIIFKLGNSENSAPVMLSNNIIDFRSWSRPGMQGGDYIAPLYLETNEYKKQKKISNEKKQELEYKLEEYIMLFEQKEKDFNAFKKLYNTISSPTKEYQKLYKEQEKDFLKIQQELRGIQNKLNPTVKNLFEDNTRKPNLDSKIMDKFSNCINLKLVIEESTNKVTNSSKNTLTFSPTNVLDYIYAVLHSPTYREKYKEFLKIDFPRVPYPQHPNTFWKLVSLGEKLRTIHLLESPILEQFSTTFEGIGTNKVEKIRHELHLTTKLVKVHINEQQCFTNVPLDVWEFYIGGYQPAQKWLKDRKDRVLSFEEVLHYQKIIVAMKETIRLMSEIDEIGFL
jgi:predicted helicase